MAITINQYPASCSLAQSPIVFSVKESPTGSISSASFQYVADLYYWTGSEGVSGSSDYTLVKYPNLEQYGIFDVSKIINSTLVDLREENPSNVVYFKLDFYSQYKSGSFFVTSSHYPTGNYKGLDGYGIFPEPIGQPIVSKSEFWPIMTDGPSSQSVFSGNIGTFGVFTGEGCNLNVDYIQYTSSTTSSLIQVSSSLTSSNQIQQIPVFPSEDGFPITYNGWYEVCPVSSSISGSTVETITNVSASFFSEAMGEGEIDFNIDGAEPILNNANSICWYTGSVNLYVVQPNGLEIFDQSGVGPRDCAVVKTVDCSTGAVELGIGYSVSAEGEAYTGSLVFANSCDVNDNIFLSSSFSIENTTIYTNVGDCIRFDEVCEKKYPNVRIKWKNRYGQYDYLNFNLVSRQSFSTTTRTYQPQLGSWQGSSLSYNQYDSSVQNYVSDSTQALSVNTDWLSEDYNEILKQLLVSDEIYWVYDETNELLRPITIATSNIQFKTGVVDKLIQYSFDFNFGQNYKLII